MTLEEYKKSKKNGSFISSLKKIAVRTLICGILVLGVLVTCNLSPSTKELVKKELFETNLNFSFVNKFYSKLFESKKDEVKTVSLNNGINYENYEDYFDGVSLSMTLGDTVSLLDSGIVVFLGEKENYGNTLIVQQSNGVDVWYGNIENVSVNLYDYVNKGTSIGSSREELYLVFQKNGEFLDYKNYIK